MSYHRGALAETPPGPARSVPPALGVAPFVVLGAIMLGTLALSAPRRVRGNARPWTHTTDLAEALYGLRRARRGLP